MSEIKRSLENAFAEIERTLRQFLKAERRKLDELLDTDDDDLYEQAGAEYRRRRKQVKSWNDTLTAIKEEILYEAADFVAESASVQEPSHPLPTITEESVSNSLPAVSEEPFSNSLPDLTGEPISNPLPALDADDAAAPDTVTEPVNDLMPVLTDPITDPLPDLDTDTANMPAVLPEQGAADAVWQSEPAEDPSDAEAFGDYVRDCMRDLEQSGYLFPHYMVDALQYADHSQDLFGIDEPFLSKAYIPGLYWDEIFRFNGEDYYIADRWDAYSLQKFDEWFRSIKYAPYADAEDALPEGAYPSSTGDDDSAL